MSTATSRMNTQEMHDVLAESQAGRLPFPEVIRRLIAVDVESYFCDLSLGGETFYMADGQTHREAMTLARNAVAAEFDGAAVVAAIRAAQADTIRYPEFVKRMTAAGAIAYWVFLAGRKVIYFGRKGESHIEEFPGIKA